MTPSEWAQIEYFTPIECGTEMKYEFMRRADMLRCDIGFPMFVLDGYATSGHADDSYHYKGEAIDFWSPADPRRVWREINRFGFGGAGTYYWGYHKPFYHVDDRPSHLYQRWVCMERKRYIYLIRTDLS